MNIAHNTERTPEFILAIKRNRRSPWALLKLLYSTSTKFAGRGRDRRFNLRIQVALYQVEIEEFASSENLECWRFRELPSKSEIWEDVCPALEQKVKQIIVEQLGVDEAQVDPTASFVDDLGADSLDIVELVMAFEEAFDLDIPDEDAEKIATVKDAVTYIESKKKS